MGVDAGEATASLVGRAEGDSPGQCSSQNSYDGQLGVRISAVFVILVCSTLGAIFPTFARRRAMGLPEWAFFIAKYFGSGVIVATAFIHLLAPANQELTDPCLTGTITEYDWVEGIALMTVFLMFFFEILMARFFNIGHSHSRGQAHVEDDAEEGRHAPYTDQDISLNPSNENTLKGKDGRPDVPTCPDAVPECGTSRSDCQPSQSHVPGTDHYGHHRDHVDIERINSDDREDGHLDHGHAHSHTHLADSYSAQMTAIFILEFGIVFHSIFIGLTLAVTGVDELVTLYVVLVFHQTFEGLGLGTRLAQAPWPKNKRWTPYVMAIVFGLSTPTAMAVGLGIRNTYAPGSATALIVNGVFDSISAGILIYTGLVELMAHEFMFSTQMQLAGPRTLFSAFGLMCLGAGLMALLGKWA